MATSKAFSLSPTTSTPSKAALTLVGFRSALTRSINSYAVSSGLLKKDDENLQGDDIREGLTAVISVKVPEPQFEGQTKTKLGNSEVKGIVEALVNEKFASYLGEHPSEAKKIVIERRRSGARARSNPQSQRLGTAQRRARFRLAARKTCRLPGTRPGIKRDSIWLRAIPPAVRPSRDATGATRRFSRSKAKFSTSKRRVSTKCFRPRKFV